MAIRPALALQRSAMCIADFTIRIRTMIAIQEEQREEYQEIRQVIVAAFHRS